MNSIYFLRKCKVALAFLLYISLSCSCKKFVEVPAPYTSFNGGNVFSTDATAIAAVTTLYTKMGDVGQTNIFGSLPTITFAAGLSADELTLLSGQMTGAALYTNELSAASAPIFWTQIYPQVYYANSSIEGLTAATQLTPVVKQQLLGEVKFMRAFLYFYLVNLYGDVPLVLSTDYKTNSLMSRAPAAQVWQQIISDLLEAKDLLNANYVGADVISSSSSNLRIRPNKWVATALLARAYLYTGDYPKAESQATEVINNTTLFGLSSFNNAFLKDPLVNKEAIWQIQTITTGWNTNDARNFILPSTGPSSTYPVYLNKRLVNSFEPGDIRVTNWINGIKVGTDSFYYSYKYKSAKLNDPITEYDIAFRLAEQYLIRAEARTQQNNISGAQSDLNIIRNRAGLPNTTAASKDDLLTAILNERKHEMFCEWGQRWLDLKRTGNVNAVMSIETPLKGGTWQTNDQYYPIPTNELQANPSLTQTPGY